MLPALESLDARERFLPVSQAAILQKMLAAPGLSAEEAGQFRILFEMIASRFHFEFHKQLERAKALYEPLDPDRDTLPWADGGAEPAERRKELTGVVERLLQGANFVEMPHDQIVACAEFQSRSGLMVHINLSDYAELRVFYRGIRREQRVFRSWLAPWRRRRETVHVFARVAMVVRLANRPEDAVFLKLFKNVVAEDLEMLLPYVRIRMKIFDQLKIGSSVAGGLTTAVWKAFTAAILSPWVFLLLLFGFGTALVRGVFSFLSSRTRYMQTLAASLYFQNLANNSSVLTHLIDVAEAEECKELLLAYYFLYTERDQDYNQEQLDQRIEGWLHEQFGLDTDFEVSDAVRKLEDKGLLVRCPPHVAGGDRGTEILRVYDLPSALRMLDKIWDEYFCYHDPDTTRPYRIADRDWPPVR